MIKFEKQRIAAIGALLRAREERVSVAESVTAGVVQCAFSQMEGASDFFAGGVTAYTIDEKVQILGVDRPLAEECNCVSREVTEQMAVGVAKLFKKTSWAIATTGYATVVDESEGQLYAFYVIVHQGKVLHSERVVLPLGTSPEEAQYRYAVMALDSFHESLKHTARKIF